MGAAVVGLLAAGILTAMTPIAAAQRAAPSPVLATVDLGKVTARTDPFALGMGSSTYGANPLSSVAQRDAEQRLDARTVRIPVGYRNGRVTSSAAGAGTTLDIAALVATYRQWGYRIVAVIGGRTNDVDVQPGDATKIMQKLGFDGISFTAPNEPGNLGKTISDQIALAKMITAEGRALKPDFAIMGPVWAYYDRTALNTFAASMGSSLAGLDYHHYAMGSESLTTAQAMAQTPSYGAEVTQLRADLAARGLTVPVTIDELNFSWRYQDGTPGGNNRFFTAVSTVWMTSALGHILRAGGRAMPYATQNGPLGIMVEAGQVNPDNRPASSPMPAYWGMANWTGGHRWPHFKDTFYETTSSDPASEVFAVNNEAGGFTVLLINKDESTSKSMSLTLQGASNGSFKAYRNNPVAPYAQPAAVLTGSYAAGAALAVELPPMTVTVVVVNPGSIPPVTTPPSTRSSQSTAQPTTAQPTTATATATTPTSSTATPTPNAPTIVTTTRSTAGSSATLRWQPPTAGGSAVTGYRISRDGADSTGGGAYATTVSAATRTFAFTLLKPDSTYRFTVQALSAASGGPIVTVVSTPIVTPPTTTASALPSATAPPSTTVPSPTIGPSTSASPPANVLGPPTTLTAGQGTDATRVTLSWRPPASTGGVQITGYRIARDGTDSTGGGAYATTLPPTAATFTFTLLNRHTTYRFTVRAVTAGGLGPESVVSLTTA